MHLYQKYSPRLFSPPFQKILLGFNPQNPPLGYELGGMCSSGLATGYELRMSAILVKVMKRFS